MLKRIFRRKTTKKTDLNTLGASSILKSAADSGESSANGDGISTDQYDEGSKENS